MQQFTMYDAIVGNPVYRVTSALLTFFLFYTYFLKIAVLRLMNDYTVTAESSTLSNLPAWDIDARKLWKYTRIKRLELGTLIIYIMVVIYGLNQSGLGRRLSAPNGFFSTNSTLQSVLFPL